MHWLWFRRARGKRGRGGRVLLPAPRNQSHIGSLSRRTISAAFGVLDDVSSMDSKTGVRQGQRAGLPQSHNGIVRHLAIYEQLSRSNSLIAAFSRGRLGLTDTIQTLMPAPLDRTAG